jgi:hypothetical protein
VKIDSLFDQARYAQSVTRRALDAAVLTADVTTLPQGIAALRVAYDEATRKVQRMKDERRKRAHA